MSSTSPTTIGRKRQRPADLDSAPASSHQQSTQHGASDGAVRSRGRTNRSATNARAMPAGGPRRGKLDSQLRAQRTRRQHKSTSGSSNSTTSYDVSEQAQTQQSDAATHSQQVRGNGHHKKPSQPKKALHRQARRKHRPSTSAPPSPPQQPVEASGMHTITQSPPTAYRRQRQVTLKGSHRQSADAHPATGRRRSATSTNSPARRQSGAEQRRISRLTRPVIPDAAPKNNTMFWSRRVAQSPLYNYELPFDKKRFKAEQYGSGTDVISRERLSQLQKSSSLIDLPAAVSNNTHHSSPDYSSIYAEQAVTESADETSPVAELDQSDTTHSPQQDMT